MGPDVALLALSLLAGAYDPAVDAALQPKQSLSLGVELHRLHDDFGLALTAASPRFGEGHFAARLTVGPAWYPDLRALPADPDQEAGGARVLYWTGRLLLEASLPLAPAAGRLYAALGPSFAWVPDRLSTAGFALGAYGVIGAELFSGDALQSYPLSLYFELGATAHRAKADVARRVGNDDLVDQSVNRPIATGLALAGGLRWYL